MIYGMNYFMKAYYMQDASDIYEKFYTIIKQIIFLHWTNKLCFSTIIILDEKKQYCNNVINGNKNADIESITFIIKLIFNDFLVFCISISSNLFALLLLNRAPPLKWKSLL